MRHRFTGILVTAALLGTLGAGSAAAEAVSIVDNADNLYSFDSATPGILATGPTPITGLAAGVNITAIDFRPIAPFGRLYGLGVGGGNGQLYSIDKITGVATPIGAPFLLGGSEFAMDFNPTVDRVRIVSDTDANMRLNPNTGAVAATDPNVAFGAADPHAFEDPYVAGLAYSNSCGMPAVTTLYYIESVFNDMGVNSVPPGFAQLNTTGPLGVNPNNLLGFDISGSTGTGYMAANIIGGSTQFFTINLATGAATLVGNIGGGGTQVRGMSISTDGCVTPSQTSTWGRVKAIYR